MQVAATRREQDETSRLQQVALLSFEELLSPDGNDSAASNFGRISSLDRKLNAGQPKHTYSIYGDDLSEQNISPSQSELSIQSLFIVSSFIKRLA